MSETRRCGLLAGLLLSSGVAVHAQGTPTVLLEAETGDRAGLVLHLDAGDYEMRRSADHKLRVLEVREAGSTARATKTHVLSKRSRVELEVDPPTGENQNGTHVILEIPRCAEFDASLNAGEMRIKEVPCEETTISMHAGELVASLSEPEQYREVKATVTVGQVAASAFDPKGQGEHGGFFPSYRWQGAGSRRFAAHVGTGEIRLER